MKEAEASYKATYVVDYAKSFNRGMTMEKGILAIQSSYPRASDRAYLQQVIKGTNRSQLRAEKSKIVLKNEKVELTLPNGQLVVIEPVGHSIAKINGREFKLDPTRSLEQTHKELIKIIEEIQSSKNAFYNLLLPQAQAFWPIIAAIVIFIVIPAIYYLLQIDNIQSKLDSTLKACEQRDKSVKFDDSEVAADLQDLKAHSIYTIEKQRSISDCADYAKMNGLRSFS